MMATVPAPKFTPEVLSQLIELLPTVESIADLGRLTGLNHRYIGARLAPFIAIMRLQGALPPCACGRERFHAGGCTANIKKRDCPFPGHRREDHAGLAAIRAMIVDMLVAGERLVDIEQTLGLWDGRAIRAMKYLTPAQCAQRKAKLAERGDRGHRKRRSTRKAKVDPAPKETRPFADPTYARIAAAVPPWVTSVTRDDIISEMYLAVRDGTLSADAIEANAGRFASAAVGIYESKFGPRSIDARLFADGTATIADMVPDPAALAAFDYITIGEPA